MITRNTKLLMLITDQGETQSDKGANKAGSSQDAKRNQMKRAQSVNLDMKGKLKAEDDKSDLGIYEFRTLLTSQAEELSRHMIETTLSYR